MIDLSKVGSLRDLDDDSLSDALEGIVSNGELHHLESSVLRIVLQESFRRDDPDVVWNALEIVANRKDLKATDLLLEAAQKQQEWSVAIFLIEQLFERSDDIDNDIFLRFLSSENGDQVRWMAARVLLIDGNVDDITKTQAIFDADSDILVRLNLAALLFLVLRNQSFFSFVQNHCNDLNLEIAKEARECKNLLMEHLS